MIKIIFSESHQGLLSQPCFPHHQVDHDKALPINFAGNADSIACAFHILDVEDLLVPAKLGLKNALRMPLLGRPLDQQMEPEAHLLKQSFFCEEVP